MGVGDQSERGVLPRRLDAGIMELMPPQMRPGRPHTPVIDQTRLAISQMQLAPGEAGRDTQQTSHRVANAGGVTVSYFEWAQDRDPASRPA